MLSKSSESAGEHPVLTPCQPFAVLGTSVDELGSPTLYGTRAALLKVKQFNSKSHLISKQPELKTTWKCPG